MHKTAMEELRECVERGVELLEDNWPDWSHGLATHKDWPDFDISSQYRCVLGLLYGDFTTGCEALELDECNLPSHYGFDGYVSDYEALEWLWRTAVDGRIQNV